jgi:two-component system chemotaxis response regulator CheY
MFPSSTRVLIVDDVESLRNLVKAYLSRMGLLRVDVAEDGEHALQLMWTAQNAGFPYEVIISDWNMPNMTGIELLKQVRQVPDWKTLSFLLLTTESEKEKIVEALHAQVSNYLIKPIEENAFRDKIVKLWEKKNSPKS